MPVSAAPSNSAFQAPSSPSFSTTSPTGPSGQPRSLSPVPFRPGSSYHLKGRLDEVNRRDRQGWTSLHMKTSLNSLAEVRSLLKAGADPRVVAFESGRTPLHTAAEKGHTQVMRHFLGMPRALDVLNRIDREGCTPLHLAARGGHAETVCALLKHPDIDVNLPNRSGSTALMFAVEQGNARSIHALLRAGSDVNAETHHGRTALHLTVKHNRVAAAELLLQHPDIDGNCIDGMGQTPLLYALARDRSDMLRCLLAAPAINREQQDERGNAPLHVAVATGKDWAVRQLLDAEVAVNAVNRRGETPLHLAARSAGADLLAMLLCSPQIEISKRNALGNTPLHDAAMAGNFQAVLRLLSKPGVQAAAHNASRHTPAEAAEAAGHTELGRLIRETLRLRLSNPPPQTLDLSVDRSRREWKEEVQRLIREGVPVERLAEFHSAYGAQQKHGAGEGWNELHEEFRDIIGGNADQHRRNASLLWTSLSQVLAENPPQIIDAPIPEPLLSSADAARLRSDMSEAIQSLCASMPTPELFRQALRGLLGGAQHVRIDMARIPDASQQEAALDLLKQKTDLRSLDISRDGGSPGSLIKALLAVQRGNRQLVHFKLDLNADPQKNDVGLDAADLCNLAKLTSLTGLSLARNGLSDSGVEHLAELNRLTTLDIWENDIGAAGARHLSSLASLTALNIWDNRLGDAGVGHLSRLTHLASLDIGDNHVGDAGAAHLAKLTGLLRLNIGNNQVGDAGAKHLAALVNLQDLDIQSNFVQADGAQHLATLTALSCLDISYNAIGNEGRHALRDALPHTDLQL